MCGRYTIVKKPEGLAEELEVDIALDKFTPRYNVAPSQTAPIFRRDRDRVILTECKWGLVPFWAKDEKIGYKMINARSETVREKPAYRRAFHKQRCLVVADGFYEWKRSGTTKVPYRILLKSEEPFVFAGLWESWTPKDGAQKNSAQELQTFAILTTHANRLVESVHDRMPVILTTGQGKRWLDPDSKPDELAGLLKPFDAASMKAYPVSTKVNNPRHISEELIQPVGKAIGGED